MATKFAICANGDIVYPSEKTAPRQMILVERRAQAINVSIKAGCSAWPMVILLRHLRQANAQITLSSSLISKDKTPPLNALLNVPETCLFLGQLALSQYEAAHENQFSSSLALWSDLDSLCDELPMTMLNIGSARLTHLDTAAALTHFTEDQLRPAAFFQPDAEQILHIGKMPAAPVGPAHVWPTKIDSDESAALQTAVAPPFGIWLTIAAETALATRRPLLQRGWLNCEGDSTTTPPNKTPFVRLFYPLANEAEKPANYRLLTLAYRCADEQVIL